MRNHHDLAYRSPAKDFVNSFKIYEKHTTEAYFIYFVKHLLKYFYSRI